MDQLRIKDLEVYAYHGVFPAEKELGQRFVLDLWVDYEMTRKKSSSGVEKTLGSCSLAIRDLFCDNRTGEKTGLYWAWDQYGR